jgi:hypothetical protein
MNRKGPPYKVVFGEEDQRPPIYVKFMESSPIQIEGSTEELEKLNLETEISYNDNMPYAVNEELISIMLSLRDLGVAFSYDYKVIVSPSAFMQILQDQGRLKGEYNEISWRGPGKWSVTTYEME